MKMQCRLICWCVFVIALVILFYGQVDAQSEEDGSEYYEEEAEYEYEYEDAAAPSQEAEVGVSGEDIVTPPVRELFYGFHRNMGSGLMKIKKPLVDETYLNETADYYDCIKRSDAWILALEANSTDTDDEFDIVKQIESMKKKVDQAVQAANSMADALTGNKDKGKEAKSSPDTAPSAPAPVTETKQNTTEAAPEGKKKRMSFREKQEIRLKSRREKEIEKEKQRPKFRLGAACETQICGSCKAIVNEFAFVVDRAVNNSEVRYVEQVLSGFCESKEIALKYNDMVRDVCNNAFQDETAGYKEALITAFEQEDSWEGIATIPRIYQQQKKVCLAVGACSVEQFEFQSEPEHQTQEQWDERCFVCQAFATDLEERVQLTRHVTERSVVPMVQETCDRLVRNPSFP